MGGAPKCQINLRNRKADEVMRSILESALSTLAPSAAPTPSELRKSRQDLDFTDETQHAAIGLAYALASPSAEAAQPVAWPDAKVTNPDIAEPTSIPYIDCLLHRLLDAQQDINFASNEGMSQSLADAASLMDEVEAAIRKLAALSQGELREGMVLVPREPLDKLFREMSAKDRPDYIKCAGYVAELKIAIDAALAGRTAG